MSLDAVKDQICPACGRKDASRFNKGNVQCNFCAKIFPLRLIGQIVQTPYGEGIVATDSDGDLFVQFPDGSGAGIYEIV